MARGWESKSIESQQDDRSRDRRPRQAPLSDEARASASARAALALQRARVLDELSRTTAPPRRAALDAALAQIDAQLHALDPS